MHPPENSADTLLRVGLNLAVLWLLAQGGLVLLWLALDRLRRGH
jgi:hypothetical protein